MPLQKSWCDSAHLELQQLPGPEVRMHGGFSEHASALCLCWWRRRLDERNRDYAWCHPNSNMPLDLGLQPEALRQRNLPLPDLQVNILLDWNYPGASSQACQLRRSILHIYQPMMCIAL